MTVRQGLQAKGELQGRSRPGSYPGSISASELVRTRTSPSDQRQPEVSDKALGSLCPTGRGEVGASGTAGLRFSLPMLAPPSQAIALPPMFPQALILQT